MIIPRVVIIAVFAAGLYALHRTYPDALASGNAKMRLAYLVALLAFLGFGVSARRKRADGRAPHSGHGGSAALLQIGAWVGAFALLVLAYGYRAELTPAWTRLTAEIDPSALIALNACEVELRRDDSGHFRARGKVNGHPVRFLVDTGASRVVLTHADALRIGAPVDTLDYVTPVDTANGRAYVAPITLARVEVGDIALDKVRAFVAQPGQTNESLLGMSFLNRLSGTSIRGNRLILKR